MAKDCYYFTHDYNSRNDPKMICLIMKVGIVGVGIYWCIVEMLYEQNGYLLHSECERIAFELRTDIDLVRLVISCDLFDKDDEKFWSKSILKRLALRKEKSEKARQSALYRHHHANAQLPQSDSMLGKEIKGNIVKLG